MSAVGTKRLYVCPNNPGYYSNVNDYLECLRNTISKKCRIRKTENIISEEYFVNYIIKNNLGERYLRIANGSPKLLYKNKSKQWLNAQIAIRKIPSKPGVYRFFSTSGKLVYIGVSTNLKGRVVSSFGERFRLRNRENRTCARSAQFSVTKTATDAYLLETYLICKHKLVLNGSQCHRSKLTITIKADISWSDELPLFGLYAHAI